jgi:putative membrane protein insertion efficiency factor
VKKVRKNEKSPDVREEKDPGITDAFEENAVTLAIKFYRRFISPAKRPCCRFTPTCSLYALQAVREWGVIFGLSLSVWRILRCNPFCKGGYDPVPENPFKKGKNAGKDGKDPDNN